MQEDNLVNETIPSYEVLIVGGGVVGTALLYTLSKYTDILFLKKFKSLFNIKTIY